MKVSRTINLVDEIRREFVEEFALLVLQGFDPKREYHKGMLHGYARAYKKLFGRELWQFVDDVNEAVKGSGKELVL